MNGRRVITLTTDFGADGSYVGAMKGAVLKVNPEATLVDITHDIPRGDFARAAFTIACAYAYFPERTIHLVVVDPGVGSDRKAIIVSTENYYFVAPDNGVLSQVAAKEEVFGIFQITEDQYFNKPLSATFHGRDIFAPVAGWLSKGIDPYRFGEAIEDMVRLSLPSPTQIKSKAWKGTIITVDCFGNLITNFTPEHIPLDDQGYPTIAKAITTKGEIIHKRRFYAEQLDQQPFMLLGSSGYFEIAVNGGSALEIIGLKPGDDIGLLLS